MPAICPAELWQESGRWEHYGKELLRIKDRNERDFCFGPTHEEVITDLVRRDVRSYRDLPHEPLPDPDQVPRRDPAALRADARARVHHEGRLLVPRRPRRLRARVPSTCSTPTRRIFNRCGLTYRPVEADTGAIGGSLSHEFQVLAESGEDAIVSCAQLRATRPTSRRPSIAAVPPAAHAGALEPMRAEVARRGSAPSRRSRAFLGVPPDRFIKTLLFVTDDGETVVVALVRGDHDAQRGQAQARARRARRWRSPTPRRCERVTGAAGRLRRPDRARGCASSPTTRSRGITERRDRRQRRRTSTSSTSRRRATSPDVAFADLRSAERRRSLPALRRRRFERPPRHRGRPGLLPRHQVQRRR